MSVRQASAAPGAPARKLLVPPRPDPLALGAWVALAVVLHARALGAGLTPQDMSALDTVLRTHLDALLRGGAFPGDFAPLSRELYWWWWGRAIPLDTLALHVLNAALAVAGAWFLYRAVERWAGARAAVIAGLVWTAFAPLGTLLAQVSGARELIAVLWVAAGWLAFARGRWILSGLAAGLAALSGRETVLLPLALLGVDALQRPADPATRRARRLLPAFLACAAAAAWLARAGGATTEPAGVAVVTWLPRAWFPHGTGTGLATLAHQAPWLLLMVVGLAALAVPRGRAESNPAERKANTLSMGMVGAAVTLLALVPLALGEPPRAERFAVAALGVALATGAVTALHPWLARGVVAVAALASLGANAALPTVEERTPRFTGSAAIRARTAMSGRLLAALKPWCADLASVPHTFAAGVPPDSVIRLALDPGARVVCRDPRISIRFLAELTPRDAGEPFGILRFDPSRPAFSFERADARVRALVGEGLLLFARHAPAAACFEAASAERPDDRELIYPTVTALAAAQRTDEARARWDAARRAGRAPAPDSLALRLLAGYAGADFDRVRPETARLVAAVVADPTSAAAHLALGRYLLEIGRVRSGTLEISIACGIGRRSQDVFWLARGYDAMGADAEALEAYRATLAGGLDSTNYRMARQRLFELLRRLGPGALGAAPRP